MDTDAPTHDETATDTGSGTGTVDLRSFASELGTALSGIHRGTRRRVRRALGLAPLSGAQVELLRLVARSPGIGVSAAARELNLAGNSVSTLVNQLVAKQYLRREPSPSDRRAAVLEATDVGRERLNRWADERMRLLAAQLARLDADELAALRAAAPALRSLAAGLSEYGAEGLDQAMSEVPND